MKKWSLPFVLCLAFLLTAGAWDRSGSAPESGHTVSIHWIELKEGVDTAEFETWVRERFNPAFRNATPGFRFYIAKADRGRKQGDYLKFLVFDAEATRNRLWPQEGKPDPNTTAELYAIWATLQPEYTKYIRDLGSDDYVELR